MRPQIILQYAGGILQGLLAGRGGRALPLILGLGGMVTLLAAIWGSTGLFLGVGVSLAVSAVILARRRIRALPAGVDPAPHKRVPAACERETGALDTSALVRQMLGQGRYSLLLRRQIIGNLSDSQIQETTDMLTDKMAMLPAGEVEIQNPQINDDFDALFDEIELPQPAVLRVGAAFIDRYPVTNEEYQRFVDAGGYEQMAIWDQEIWPAVLDFVDATGHPGPRYWSHGRYPDGQGRHPVVGVSWFEAQAFSRWVGKRLITDAEWVKSAAWPVPLSPTSRVQRRFPWGDEMDRGRANLWNEGIGSTVAVDQFPTGVSTGGVYQLVGNTWEWTGTDFHPEASPFGRLTVSTPMKTIRGGAFDTYFETQADCRFQSAENPVARKHNVGFRCAISASDLVLKRPRGDTAEDLLAEAVNSHVEPCLS